VSQMGWQVSSLGEVLHKTDTVDPRKSPDKLFQYVDVSSVSRTTFSIQETTLLEGANAPSRARRQIKAGDVLFATIRPTLQRIAIVPDKLDGEVCSTGYFVLRPVGQVNNRFLYYYLFTAEFMEEIEKRQKGASYPAVNDGDVRQQKISYPPLPEQKQIVAILDKAFAAIDQAVANAERSLTNARELFESYLNKVFTERGESWVEKRLGDICEIKHGYPFKSNFFASEGSYVLLTPGSFYGKGGFREQGRKTKYYTGEIPKGFLLDKGDFLIAMTEQAVGLLGSSLVVPESDRFLHNQRLGLVMVNDNVSWSNDFFHHQLNTKAFRDAVQATASGVKVRHTSPKKLYKIPVVFPNKLLEQQAIAESLNKVKAEVEKLEAIYQQKLTALTELKQSILQKAFRGELTAGDSYGQW